MRITLLIIICLSVLNACTPSIKKQLEENSDVTYSDVEVTKNFCYLNENLDETKNWYLGTFVFEKGTSKPLDINSSDEMLFNISKVHRNCPSEIGVVVFVLEQEEELLQLGIQRSNYIIKALEEKGFDREYLNINICSVSSNRKPEEDVYYNKRADIVLINNKIDFYNTLCLN